MHKFSKHAGLDTRKDATVAVVSSYISNKLGERGKAESLARSLFA